MRVMNDGAVSTKEIRERQALELAYYMIENDSRILDMEKEFEIPHTTIHRRLTITLKGLDEELWKKCDNLLYIHRIKHRYPTKE